MWWNDCEPDKVEKERVTMQCWGVREGQLFEIDSFSCKLDSFARKFLVLRNEFKPRVLLQVLNELCIYCNTVHRLGFCQLAIDNSAGLVPVFTFGENDLFEPTPQKWLDWWGKVNQRYIRIGALWPIRGR